jgi:hypothetical protein
MRDLYISRISLDACYLMSKFFDQIAFIRDRFG